MINFISSNPATTRGYYEQDTHLLAQGPFADNEAQIREVSKLGPDQQIACAQSLLDGSHEAVRDWRIAAGAWTVIAWNFWEAGISTTANLNYTLLAGACAISGAFLAWKSTSYQS